MKELAAKKLEITLESKQNNIRGSNSMTPTNRIQPFSNKVSMMNSLVSFKTLMNEPDFDKMVGKVKLKPLDKALQNAAHSNSFQNINYTNKNLIKSAAALHTQINKTQYVRMSHDKKLPFHSLKSQIDNMNQALKEQILKNQMIESESIFSSLPRTKNTTFSYYKAQDLASKTGILPTKIASNYPLLSEKLSKSIESMKRNERVLLSELSSENAKIKEVFLNKL